MVITLLTGGAALAFRAWSVWLDCGYDCSVTSLFHFTVTTAFLLSLLLVVIGCSFALGIGIDRGSRS
jgi:hypothetical protein